MNAFRRRNSSDKKAENIQFVLERRTARLKIEKLHLTCLQKRATVKAMRGTIVVVEMQTEP